ncbi:MAG: 50S ribosomal protein L11 methyltransferase [Desulfatiglandales bacterium]
MKIQITIDGPARAIKELYQKLRNFSPIIENPHGQIEGKDEKAQIILIENEENLDNKLLTVSRIVKKLQKDLSLAKRLEFRVRNLAYSEPATVSHLEPFKPIPSITIQPWDPSLFQVGDDRTIIIDPHHAFGTGSHPTSRLCLKYLDQLAQGGSPEWRLRGQEVLDFGCGTGLLAIAAVKLGAKGALGVEIDHQSTLAAKKNVELNGLSGKIDIQEGSWEVVQKRYDLILANLVASALLKGGEQIPKHLKGRGIAVISGFSPNQVEEMESFFMGFGLIALDRSTLEGWSALVMVKGGNEPYSPPPGK